MIGFFGVRACLVDVASPCGVSRTVVPTEIAVPDRDLKAQIQLAG
jgi:hypothetical protein